MSDAHVDDVRELGDGQEAQLVAGPDSDQLSTIGTLVFVDSNARHVTMAHEVTQLAAPASGRSG